MRFTHQHSLRWDEEKALLEEVKAKLEHMHAQVDVGVDVGVGVGVGVGVCVVDVYVENMHIKADDGEDD